MVGGSSAIGGRFGSSRLMAWTPPSGRRVRPLQATPPPSRAPMPRPWASSSCRSFAASLLALVIVGELQFFKNLIKTFYQHSVLSDFISKYWNMRGTGQSDFESISTLWDHP